MRELARFIAALVKLHPRLIGSAEKVAAVQDRKFRALIKTAAARSAFYRRKFHGIDLDTCRICDLPTLTKNEMMQNFDEVVTEPGITKQRLQQFMDDPANLGKLYQGRFAVAHTSGSQGRPALIVQDRDALALAFGVQVTRGSGKQDSWLQHTNHVFSPAKMAVITQRPGFYPSGATFSYLPSGLKPFFKTHWFSVFDPIEKTIAGLNDLKPNYITGYTSSLEVLAREEEAGRLRLRAAGCLEQITNISELLPHSTLDRIEQTFGVPVTDQYAMGECLALTCGCPGHHGSHLNSDLAILEVVDEQYRPVPDGQKGAKVLLTNLYNLVQPFIRYEIDDIVTMSAQPCPCGSVLPLVESIEGRAKDKLWIMERGRARDLPYYLFLAALHNELDMAEHQVVQTGVNKYQLLAAPLPGRQLSTERLRQLVYQSVASEGLERTIELDISIVDSIERGPSGKAIRVKNLFGPPTEAAMAGTQSA